MIENDMSRIEPMTLVAKDGYPIAATRFVSKGEERGHLIVAGATGVQQRFYRRFAEYASSKGFTTLTLDYRGIGQSKPETLKGFEMSFLDWGRLDLAAAVDAMASASTPLFLVGHSYGGHALGLLPNHDRLSACYSFGCGAGWTGWMPTREALKTQLLWKFIFPALVSWKGYLAWSILGMGEDLPKGVYKGWKKWGAFPHYFFDDPSMPDMKEVYARVRTPLVAATAMDDFWAPPRSRDAFIKAYRNAPLILRDIATGPGAISIGHMGYFRATAQPLWDDVLNWFLSLHTGKASRGDAIHSDSVMS